MLKKSRSAAILCGLALSAAALYGCNHAAPTTDSGPAVPAPPAGVVTVDAASTVAVVPPTAIGINTAVWDSNLLDANLPGLLKPLGVRVLRFPGGSTSDVYHWQTQSPTANSGYLNRKDTFDAFMGLASSVGAAPIITVNYGSNLDGTGGGDPAEAAAWVQYANVTKRYGVRYWEIGNEVYGNGFYGADWEGDLHAPDNPSHSGRKGNPNLGPTEYGANAAVFIRAMKAVDPTIKVGVALCEPGQWPDNQWPEWNSNVLQQCGPLIDFAIIHLYPQGSGHESDAGLLSSTGSFGPMLSQLRGELNQYCGLNAARVQIFVTETNSVSFNPGKQTVSIVNALFLADDYMTWLESGVANVDWWALHNGANKGGNNSATLAGSANYGDYGLLSSGGGAEPAPETPFPSYYGMEMLAKLIQPGDRIVRAQSGDPLIAVHAVLRPEKTLAILLINQDPTRTHTFPLSITGFKPSDKAAGFLYGPDSQALEPIRLDATSAGGISVPAYTMEVAVLGPKR